MLFCTAAAPSERGGRTHATEQPYTGQRSQNAVSLCLPVSGCKCAAIAVWRSRPVCGGGFLRGAKRGRRLYRHTGDANCHKPRHRPYAGQHRHHWAVYRPGGIRQGKARHWHHAYRVCVCGAGADGGHAGRASPASSAFADAAACLRACGAVCHRVHAGQPVHLRL